MLTLFDFLHTPTDVKEAITEQITYHVYKSYVNKTLNQTTEVSFDNVLHVIFSNYTGQELTLAAYVFGQIEKEADTEQYQAVFKDIAKYGYAIYNTIDLSCEQYLGVGLMMVSYFNSNQFL